MCWSARGGANEEIWYCMHATITLLWLGYFRKEIVDVDKYIWEYAHGINPSRCCEIIHQSYSQLVVTIVVHKMQLSNRTIIYVNLRFTFYSASCRHT